MIRRIQQLRKTADLVKSDRIDAEVTATHELLREAILEHKASVAERCGASRFELVDELRQDHSHTSTEKIKGAAFMVGFKVVS